MHVREFLCSRAEREKCKFARSIESNIVVKLLSTQSFPREDSSLELNYIPSRSPYWEIPWAFRWTKETEGTSMQINKYYYDVSAHARDFVLTCTISAVHTFD